MWYESDSDSQLTSVNRLITPKPHRSNISSLLPLFVVLHRFD